MEGKTKKERGEYPWAPKDALPSVKAPAKPAPEEMGEEPTVEKVKAPKEKPLKIVRKGRRK